MDCPHRIPPSGTPACHHRPKYHSAATLDQTHTTVRKTGKDAVGLDHNPILTDITAKVTMTPTGAVPGHTTGITDVFTGVVHDAHTQTLIHIILSMTLHITDHLPTEALQLTTGITAYHVLNQLTNLPRKPHINLHHIPEDHKVNHIPNGIQELQSMTHKWTFTVQMTIPVIQKRTQTI